MAYDQVKLASMSEDIKAKLLSNDEQLVKTAGLAADEYFRTEIRENGIRRQLTPPVQITDENLDYVEDTDFPVMFVEVAPHSAGAVQVSFEAGPSNEVIHGRKTRVEFNRIMTPKYSIDKIRLKGYKMPLLDILYDLMLKDIMDVEDKTSVDTDKLICGNPVTAGTPTAQDNQVAAFGCRRAIYVGAMSRNALNLAKKGMMKVKGHLQVEKFLVNDSTYADLGVFTRDIIGGDMAQDIWLNGVTQTKSFGVDIVVTTKDYLIADNEMFLYTTPKYYGGFYTYEDVSMVTDTQDDIWLSFFAHETTGFSVVNAAGVARVLFEGDAQTWRP